ncbi:MAG: hypothetical protein DRI24_03920 [Deltaproteobacteria bacterium]|nr:MAG: hypothetical protein DRI24_03920 [Deltaproteobacteria bacterium]
MRNESMCRLIKYHVVTMLTLMLFGVSGCGIKGLPVPPRYSKPPAVSDLQYQVVGNQINLTWSVPIPKQASDNHTIAGAKVLRLKESLKNLPCRDCPQTFRIIRKIPARSETMQFQDTIDKGFRYYYKIVLYDAGNQDGEDSDIVRVENRK